MAKKDNTEIEAKTIDRLPITYLERLFIEKLIPQLYAEPGFSDVDIVFIATLMDVSTKTAKGVLGSLVKKGIVDTYQIHANHQTSELIVLNPEYYYLHPNWSKS